MATTLASVMGWHHEERHLPHRKNLNNHNQIGLD